MKSNEFTRCRQQLRKTQKEFSHLLGVSLGAIHGYEQGWRVIPGYVERQIFFLKSRLNGASGQKPCWQAMNCPPELKKKCPAWEFKAGQLCWFVNGTFCKGRVQKSWPRKMAMCRKCKVFKPLLK